MTTRTRYLLAIPFALVFVSILGLLFYPVYAGPRSPQVPSGFSLSTVVSGVSAPVDMEFLPSGDFLVVENGTGPADEAVAHVWLVRSGQLLEQPVATLSTNNFGDAGVQSLILDPNFEENHHFYIWYATGLNSVEWSGQSVYRLSRFTFDPRTEHIVPGSETVILDGIPLGSAHNGGGLAFDDAGNLYIATGDIDDYETAQDLSSLNGKVLRIHPEEDGYSIPADNPFVDTPGARDEIYAYGFRNPFRMVRRSTDGTLLLADVGLLTWEEIDRIVPGANYGWPIREGPCPLGERQPCSPAPAQYTDPILYYEHVPGEGGSITGITLYEGSAFPSAYHGNLFFADFSQQFLGTVDADALLSEPAAAEDDIEYFAQEIGALVDIEYSNGALYLLDIFAGSVQELSYDPDGEQKPMADSSVEPALGGAPLTVTLSAEATPAAETESVVYRWNFGDESPVTFTLSPNVTHTYTADGTYIAGVRVVDDALRVSEPASTTITVYSGELPRIQLTNQTEAGRTQYYGGDTIHYEVVRSTGTSDLDPDVPYTWRIDLHHDLHKHPIVSGAETSEGTFDIPRANHGGTTALWYEFTLTMHAFTDGGEPIDVEVAEPLYPATATLSLDTVPYHTEATINHVNRTLPYTFTSITGVENSVDVPETILRDREIYSFGQWSLPTMESPSIVFVAPPENAMVTGTYEHTGPAYSTMLPVVY